MRFLLCALLILASVASRAAEIKGKVTNTLGGEALGQVQVSVLGTKVSVITSPAGEFTIPNLPPGKYILRLNAVSYRLLTIPFSLATDDDIKEFSITMVPDNFHHADKVEVRGDLFQVSDSPATTEMTLTSSEIRETSTVFADDPFRAVQTLPGVSAEGNNEFFAEFSVMGAAFPNVGVYIDDVVVLNPFHEIGNFSEGASLGVLTSEVVEEMKLLPAAFPERLEMQTEPRSTFTPATTAAAPRCFESPLELPPVRFSVKAGSTVRERDRGWPQRARATSII